MRAVVKVASVAGPDGTVVREVDRPSPGPGEVVIRVAATAICGTDRQIYRWEPSIRPDVSPPRIYGHEFCGYVDEVGPHPGRDDLSPRDYVSAEMHVVCGRCRPCRSGRSHVCTQTRVLGMHDDGAFADFVRVPAANVIKLSEDRVPLSVGAFLDALGNAVHAAQVADLAGSAVLITGFGPLGAMAAAIAEHCGARTVIVTDVSDHALETARRWAAGRNFSNLHAFNAASDSDALKSAVLDITNGHGAEIVLEMSGAPSAVNFGLDVAGAGATVALLGIPAGGTLLLEEYARTVIFKGLRLQGVVGRRMYDTWHRMLSLLESGLDVGWVVEREYSSLDHIHDAMECLERREALKVVLYPDGR